MLYLVCAAVIVLLDQLFKLWIVRSIPLGGQRALIPGVIQLTHVHNEAAAFSLFRGLQVPIIILTLIISLAIIVALVRKKPNSGWQRLALALVLGGAVGNVLDRLINGYVVDMFQTLFINFAVFNIADCAIVVGGSLFCLCVILESSGSKTKKAPLPSPEESAAVFDALDAFKAEGMEERQAEEAETEAVSAEERDDDPSDQSGG